MEMKKDMKNSILFDHSFCSRKRLQHCKLEGSGCFLFAFFFQFGFLIKCRIVHRYVKQINCLCLYLYH